MLEDEMFNLKEKKYWYFEIVNSGSLRYIGIGKELIF